MSRPNSKRFSQPAPITMKEIETTLNNLKDQVVDRGEKLDKEQQSLFCEIRCSLAQPTDSESPNVNNPKKSETLTNLINEIWKCEIALREKSLGSNPVSIVAL